jgi:hypothetical protein
MLQHVQVYQVIVFTAADSGAAFEQAFLFKPGPDDLILAIQDEIGQLERAVKGSCQEDAEQFGAQITRLQHLCEVAAAAKSLECHEDCTTINRVEVAGTFVGSVHIRQSTALAKESV